MIFRLERTRGVDNDIGCDARHRISQITIYIERMAFGRMDSV